jgi:hypothetical protein
MDKIPHYLDFYNELLTEGDQCLMANISSVQSKEILAFVSTIPADIIYDNNAHEYGRETIPHITVLYGIEREEEKKAMQLASKIPGRIKATLGKISKFSTAEFDVIKIDVESPTLRSINKFFRSNVKYANDYPNYSPHVTLAYVKKGTGNEFVGNNLFMGREVILDTYVYSTGDNGKTIRIPMSKLDEYFVGQSGGYGSASGGATAARGWAGTYGGPETSGRLGKQQSNRRSSYMQGNTVVNNSLYDTIRPEDLKHDKFSPDDIMAGLRYEMKRMEYPDKNKARPVVLKNLEKNPHYYSDLGQYHMDGKY